MTGPLAPRLQSASAPQGSAAWPDYAPEDHGYGIVHLGLGNFARAHIAYYTDQALALAGGDWRILGVSLRGNDVAEALNPQQGRYSLIEQGTETQARVIGAISHVLAGSEAAAKALIAMADPRCRIVSITVTEKGYGIDSAGVLDRDHPAVAADLRHPDRPSGVVGLLAAALALRHTRGLLPFTALSCDNLSHNGSKLRAAVIGFAAATHGPALAAWIEAKARFPQTMVDRITPASTPQTRQAALEMTGYHDAAAVETEPFCQWVIEDDFCNGRPAWDRVGALMVADVSAYEKMKLRMLNGAHSMLAYSGQLAGRSYVRDVMRNPDHARLVRAHLDAAASTLEGLQLDLVDYAQALQARFANPAIAHATAQIAMDGSQKLPQRITAPALEAVAKGLSVMPYALALAAWIAWVARRDSQGQRMMVDDPKAAALHKAAGATEPATLIEAIAAVCPDILPPELTGGDFGTVLQDMLGRIQVQGMAHVIAQEAQQGLAAGL